MNELNFFFAFSAGALATFNPCGWVMLPTFVSYYLGSREAEYEQRSFAARAAEGLTLGLLVTGGFLLVFIVAAIILSIGLRYIVRYLPFGSLITGIALVVLGFWLLAGKPFPFSVALPQINVSRARNPKSAFVFGIGYALASLSCTLPVFLSIVGASLTISGLLSGAIMFGGYALGMAVVLMSVAIGTALLKGAIAQWYRKFLPHVYRISAVMLIVAGMYLIWKSIYVPLILSGV
jgi:cytochrome c biogenesis protein CcdA